MGEIRFPHKLYADFFPDENPKPISHEERKKRTNGFPISKAIVMVPMLLSLRNHWPFDRIFPQKIAGPRSSSPLSSTAHRAVKIASEKDRRNSCLLGALSHSRLLNILSHLKAKGEKRRNNEPKKVAATPSCVSCWKPEKGMRKAVEFLTMKKKRKKKEDREAIWRRPVMRGRRCRDLRKELPPYEKEERRTVVGEAAAVSTQARLSNCEEEDIWDYWSCMSAGFIDEVEANEEDSLFSIELGLGGMPEKRTFSS